MKRVPPQSLTWRGDAAFETQRDHDRRELAERFANQCQTRTGAINDLAALLDAADELDRLRQEKRAEQVERIKAEHLRIRVQGKSYCVVDGMEWPCLSIKNLETDATDTGDMTC